MKKSLLLAILFPLAVVSLTGCVKYNGKNKDGSPKDPTTTTTTTEPAPTTDTSSDTSTEPPVPPAPTGSINLYLVLGPHGLYEGAAGTTYATKYLENTKVITVEKGAALPGKEIVTSEIEGSTFLHWVDRATTDILSKAPAVEGVDEAVLVAVFEGGNGGNTPTPSDGLPSEGYGFLFDELVDGKPYYKKGEKVADFTDGDGNTFQQYHIQDFQMVVGQRFQLYDFGAKAGWTVPLDEYSCGHDVDNYIVISGGYYNVIQTFNAKDIYIKLLYEHDQLYIGKA